MKNKRCQEYVKHKNLVRKRVLIIKKVKVMLSLYLVEQLIAVYYELIQCNECMNAKLRKNLRLQKPILSFREQLFIFYDDFKKYLLLQMIFEHALQDVNMLPGSRQISYLNKTFCIIHAFVHS